MEGWAKPEKEFAWALGPACRLILTPRTAPAGTVLLELNLNPFVLPGAMDGQCLNVFVGGVQLGHDRIIGEGTVGYFVPAHVIRGTSDIVVTLRMPDSRRPIDLGFNDDTRLLGFMCRSAALLDVPIVPDVPRRLLPPQAFASATGGAESVLQAVAIQLGLMAAALVSGFESLGHNCEFGVVQRQCGIESLGLLRFAGISLPDLLGALDTEFAGLGSPDQFEVVITDDVRPEFLIRDTRHQLMVHTRRFPDQTNANEVTRMAGSYLSLLRRKFFETMRESDRIFVVQRPGQTLASQALPLLTRLRAYGLHALLFVVEGSDYPPGTVEELGFGLFRGWIHRLAPQRAIEECNLAAWLSLCANTRRLWDVQRAMCQRPGSS